MSRQGRQDQDPGVPSSAPGIGSTCPPANSWAPASPGLTPGGSRTRTTGRHKGVSQTERNTRLEEGSRVRPHALPACGLRHSETQTTPSRWAEGKSTSHQGSEPTRICPLPSTPPRHPLHLPGRSAQTASGPLRGKTYKPCNDISYSATAGELKQLALIHVHCT